MRALARASTEASGVTTERVPATFWKRAGAGATRLSTSVFQTPQLGH
jgi:hypothetical protein